MSLEGELALILTNQLQSSANHRVLRAWLTAMWQRVVQRQQNQGAQSQQFQATCRISVSLKHSDLVKPCTHVETRNRIYIWVIWGGVGVITFMSTWTHMDYMVCIAIEYASGSFGVRVGWGGGNNVHVNLKICHATLWDFLLHLHYAYLCLGGGGCGGVGHVNVPWTSTLSMLHSCKQSKVCSTWNLDC